jgi:predicted GH43/DUF377 family glycosyl hydrolase
MNTESIHLQRTGSMISPVQSRVLLRPFYPGDAQQAARIIERIMTVPEDQVGPLLDEISTEFSKRHSRIDKFFQERFNQIHDFVSMEAEHSKQRQLLIGAYFSCEFSLESAALFNPSIVPHPDQSDLPPGALRFILSLRATGEGHISSIVFRTGIIDADYRIQVEPPSGFLSEPRHIPNIQYVKALFERKLLELRLTNKLTGRVMNKLGETFTLEELNRLLEAEVKQLHFSDAMVQEHLDATQGIWALAQSNYEVQFDPGQNLSERVIFPATPSQRNGIEDARFVRFRHDDGTTVYYATYTAYDGRSIMPELVETSDFLRFRVITLNGTAAENKGMALFPRKINGRYAMLSRQDNENIFLMFSDNIHFWYEHKMLLQPIYPWELIKLGNCGSPIETDAGWLVLSHGVGPLRKYCIGAFLLDKDNPAKVIGRLREPFLKPSENEREGYVPNVVYTCGALVHNGTLIIPYGVADYSTRFATVPLSEVLAAMS